MNSDPLAGLKDIHLPPDISWWPPAPGWWVLAVLCLLLLIFIVYKCWQVFARRRYRKEALRELAMIRNTLQDSGSEQYLQKLSALLRRVALHRHGRFAVADLTDEEWLAFLDRTGRTDAFTNGPGRVFGLEMYKANAGIEPETVVAVVEKWIRSHR